MKEMHEQKYEFFFVACVTEMSVLCYLVCNT